MTPTISLRKALGDPNLLGATLVGESWFAWKVLLLASMGEPLADPERIVFTQLTGRQHEPNVRVEELIGVIGRRGGKSRAISVLASYISGLCNHPNLVPGERGVLLIIAPDQRQADIVLDYITANFEASPILRQLIETRTQRTLTLTNRIDIEVRSSDFRRLRGPTYIAIIADESAFWLSENSTNPDSEILAAVRPGLATTGGPLFVISSPYARRGELWQLYFKHFGPAGDPAILVAQAASRVMNPSLPQSVINRAMERDATSASAEYLAQFRRDIETFVSIEAVRACVAWGVFERPPQSNLIYFAFVDCSGGGGTDSMALCIGHRNSSKGVIVIDTVRERRPPFSPAEVCREFSQVLKSYRVHKLIGDKFGGGFPPEQFRAFDILFEQSAKAKSDLYIDLLPLVNSQRVELLDNPRLISQLTSLERRTARSGKDSIDHPPGGHDDLINALCWSRIDGIGEVCQLEVLGCYVRPERR
jgi:hypothetical protein